MVGSDKKEKNRSMAFKAFKLFLQHHPNHKLVIVGDDSNEKEKELIKELDISQNVIFKGKDNNWHKKYASSEMFVLTSDFEGMPNALLEACALQIPCISTNCPCGGPEEILECGKNGMLVEINDHNGLAVAMETLSSNPLLRNEYSDNSKGVAEKYNPSKIGNLWIEYLKSLI